ncbi:hypothetical protein ARMGADRAFT_1040649 [Armillaria gallica]|uniref:Uncharacterized protein n=1 Tax=Armillaria gallica TaxID=47427 RepID=A0A2H3CE81_ARMGA|nr:hypothetical protein ARMGADRAFT_1040649 [Armillaria gallica]
MATQANIPSDLPDTDKALIFQFLDAELNSRILFTLLYGIFGVTLWNIFINKCWPIRRAMVIVIILLHALITISFAVEWSFLRSEFVENGRSFWTVYLRLGKGPAQSVFLAGGIASSISTILTDLYMIWCCWIVWGRRWVVVLFPILFLISATGKVSDLIYSLVTKIIKVYLTCIETSSEIFATLYISCVLATTLWCTVLIIYCILTVAGVKQGAGGRLRVYQHFIEVLVESSAFYSISLIVYLALTIRGSLGPLYLDVITGIAKGVAPTLIVGRITAGHRARPDDLWQGSVIGQEGRCEHGGYESGTYVQVDIYYFRNKKRIRLVVNNAYAGIVGGWSVGRHGGHNTGGKGKTAMERLEGEMDLTAAFPDVENGVGWKQGRRGGDQNRVATHDDQALWVLAHGGMRRLGRSMVQGMLMLTFDEVGSGGHGNGRRIMVLGTFIAASSRTSKLKKACPSCSSSSASIPIFILASSSMSPTLWCVPSKLSFPNIAPLDCLIAPQWSITTPAHVVIVTVVSLVVIIIVAMCTFDSPSHTEMTADVESLHVAYTLVGYWVDWDGDGGQICGHGSGQCLCRGWEQDMHNPKLLGPPDAWKEAKKQLEVI